MPLKDTPSCHPSSAVHRCKGLSARRWQFLFWQGCGDLGDCSEINCRSQPTQWTVSDWREISRGEMLEVYGQGEFFSGPFSRFNNCFWCEQKGSGNSIEMALWSDSGVEFEMTRSRVCPLECVGTSTCCWMLRQSNNCRNSAAKRQEGVSTWILSSQSIIMLAEVVHSVVWKSCISEIKTEFGLGGR